MRESIRTFKGLDKKAQVKFTKDGAIVVGSKMSLSDIAQIKNSGPKAKVKIVPGTVYINEKPLVEPYTLEDPNDSYPELYKINPNDSGNIVTLHGLQSMKIPKGKLLVMGDNRNDSFDARFWGLLDRKRMQGKAMFIFWPIPRVRWVH
jgi:signal peptidase I